jgi:hypothetical protein
MLSRWSACDAIYVALLHADRVQEACAGQLADISQEEVLYAGNGARLLRNPARACC